MGDKKVASLTTIDTEEEEDKRHMGYNSLLNRIEKRKKKRQLFQMQRSK